MFDFVFYDKDDTSVNINDIVSSENNYDNVILDDNNVITVNKLNDERHLFLFKHKKLINNELVEVSNWTLKEYDPKIRDVVIKEQNMFLVQGIKGQINAIYNYEQTKFIVSPGIWSNICYSNNNPKAPKINYLKEYNGLLANLYISTSSKDGVIFDNPITKERIEYTFRKVEHFSAILNIDGTIRNNKLFKYNEHGIIEEIINLNNYKSLDEFKQQRKAELEVKRTQELTEYKQKENTNIKEEIIKVLKI